MQGNMVGDPHIFAVEYSVRQIYSGLVYGECGVWIGGFCLQDAAAIVCLNAVAAGLRGLSNAPVSEVHLPKSLPAAPWELLQIMEGKGFLPNSEKHYFLAIEGFDDFLKIYFKNERGTDFLCSVHPDFEFEQGYSKFSGEVRHFAVPNDIVGSVAQEFFSTIEFLSKKA